MQRGNHQLAAKNKSSCNTYIVVFFSLINQCIKVSILLRLWKQTNIHADLRSLFDRNNHRRGDAFSPAKAQGSEDGSPAKSVTKWPP